MSQTLADPAVVPGIAAGRLEQISGDVIVFGVPDTDYRLHLVASAAVSAQVGERITGRIRARARRVDVVPSGGRYVEPVFGRPRRIQGRLIGGDVAANTITVDAAVPITVALMPAQQAADFCIGQLVSFDIERGATFTPDAAV